MIPCRDSERSPKRRAQPDPTSASGNITTQLQAMNASHMMPAKPSAAKNPIQPITRTRNGAPVNQGASALMRRSSEESS